MMRRVAALLTLWLPMLTQSVAAQGTGRPESSRTPAWRTSWAAFADDVDAFRKTAADFPSPSFQMLAGGQEVPDTFSVKRRYAGAVTWEGIFKGVTNKESTGATLMVGQDSKLTVEMPSAKQGWVLHVYPSAAALDRWKALPSGISVRFRAQFKGVAGFQPLKAMIDQDKVVYYLLLTDAEPAEK